MNKVKTFVNLSALLITLPISYAQTIMLYQYVKAPSYVWLLFWINLPILLLVQIINAIVTRNDK